MQVYAASLMRVLSWGHDLLSLTALLEVSVRRRSLRFGCAAHGNEIRALDGRRVRLRAAVTMYGPGHCTTPFTPQGELSPRKARPPRFVTKISQGDYLVRISAFMILRAALEPTAD